MPPSKFYGFDLSPGTNQVARLRRPHSNFKKLHPNQWTDENRRLDGDFEIMDRFADEVIAQSKRMQKTPKADTTPLNDPFFARSIKYVGTALDALNIPDHVVPKAHLDMIIKWAPMSEATTEYTHLELTPQAREKFIANPMMEPYRPAWAVHTPETDEVKSFLFGNLVVNDNSGARVFT